MILSAPLIAAWFVNPALLGGLGLIALPILIHFLSRRRFRRVEWGATRFLLEAERENRRRVRFEQWLLLALRCLAMALLALLVARPFLQPGLLASLLGGRGQVQRIVIIDDSASLAYSTERGSDFALLRDSAGRLLEGLSSGASEDPTTIYLTSRPTEPIVIGERLSAANLSDLQAHIDRLKPTNLPAHPRRVLETVARDLAAAGSEARADIYVLSDFQRSEWLGSMVGTIGSAEEQAAGRSVFEPIAELDPGAVRVVLIATGESARDNVALLDASLARPQTVAGLPAVLNATVANYSGETLDGARVQVEVNGTPLPPVPVEPVAPGESRSVALEVTFPDEGFSEVVIGVDRIDGFALDNTHRLALPVKSALRVLLVDGQPATDAVLDEVYFLRNALAPAGPFASGIDVRTIDPDQIEGTPLDSFDCVMLCNVPVQGPGAVAALERYVSAGGGLVIFLGENAGDPDEYNRRWYADGTGLLPLPLRELCRSGRSAGGDPDADARARKGVGLIRTVTHPVTAMFPAGEAALSEYVRFRAYYRCAEMEPTGEIEPPATVEGSADSRRSTSERPPAVVLARFTDAEQTPALIERPLGRGRVLLFTSSADLDWNDWARAVDGSYVVTALELVQYAATRGAGRLAFLAGETLELTVSPEDYEPTGVFRSPPTTDEPTVEARVRGPVAAVGESLVLEGPVATRLGTYTLELDPRDGGHESRPICVNLDPIEFDLASARTTELDAALGGVPHTILEATAAFRNDDEQARRELWPVLLIALVVVLMLEQMLAWWFGTPGRGGRKRARMTMPFGAFGRTAR